MMKYYKESLNDLNEFVSEEISKEQAIEELSYHYKNAEECVELPCYYRTPFGGINVIENDEPDICND